MTNPYDTGIRQQGRRIIEYPLHQPAQAPLPLDTPLPELELTIEERFWQFHAANPHIYARLRELALLDAQAGIKYISTKWLFERLRREHVAVARDGDLYRLNNVFTSRYARLLAAEPELIGRIPMRALKAE